MISIVRAAWRGTARMPVIDHSQDAHRGIGHAGLSA
jgi:hypothetical protein